MKHSLIGLAGYAGAGKDTVADLLVAHRGFRKLAFADALRDEVAEAFGIEQDDLLRPETKSHATPALALRRAPLCFLRALVTSLAAQGDPNTVATSEWLDAPRSPRQILQWWGTDYRRAGDPQYWLREFAQRLARVASRGHRRIVVPDVRFANEADTIHGAGGVLWQVTRPRLDASTTSEGSHVSANDGSAFRPAAVIANRHDIRHLQQLVLDEVEALRKATPGAVTALPT
jgi:hypothetical protein